jgi:hypothetical protein
MNWPPTPDGCSLCLSIYQDAIAGSDDARSRQPPLNFISAGSILTPGTAVPINGWSRGDGKQATPSAVPVGVCKRRTGGSSYTNVGNIGCSNLLSPSPILF